MSPDSSLNDRYHEPIPGILNTSLERLTPRTLERDQPGGTNCPVLSPLPRLQRLLSPNELSYYLPSRAHGANDMCMSYELWAPPELMTPYRLLLAWSILRLRHPLIGSRISHLKPKPPLSPNPLSKPSPFSTTKKAGLDAYYRSAAFVLDPPTSPEAALEQSRSTLDARVAEQEKMRSEDLLWEFSNGPRILSVEKLMVLTIVKSDTEGQETNADGSAPAGTVNSGKPRPSQNRAHARYPRVKREQYVMQIALMHCAIDGVAAFIICEELLELIGGSSATPSHTQAARKQPIDPAKHIPRTEAQLRAVLRAEWDLRYGAASPLRQARKGQWNGFAFMPASFEARVPLFVDQKAAIEDFQRDQSRYEGGHTLFRQSPSSILSPTSPSTNSNHPSIRECTRAQTPTPKRQNANRYLVFSPYETLRILRHCKAEGVSVQMAMFAVLNVAWLRMLDRARRAIQSRSNTTADSGFEAMKVWAEKCGGPTLLYSAVNLRPLVGNHEHTSRIPEAFRSSPQAQAAWRRQDAVTGPISSVTPNAASTSDAGTSVPRPDPIYVAVGYFNVQLPDGAKRGHDAAAKNDFWTRAREAKRQTAEAVGSSHMIARTVLMGEERGARSVRFAMEDDGYVPRPARLTVPSTSAPSSPSQPPKATTTPAPNNKATAATALMGLTLVGAADSTWSFHLFPTITPTLCRCTTRKADGGSLIFVYTCRGSPHVGFGWDEKAFPEFDVVLPESDGAVGVGMQALYQDMRDVVADFMLGGIASGVNAKGARGLDMSGRTRLREWDEDHYAVPLLSRQKNEEEEEEAKSRRYGAIVRSVVMQLAKL
ncbi:hypothetical protein DL93DRAFT_2095866 [Clavulina sp. PMI_390]|nr:hypothetical protein DL93DRAFT_2095866 [Clavulina sp. PMI_390]